MAKVATSEVMEATDDIAGGVTNSATVDEALRKAQTVISKQWIIIIYVAVGVADEK